NSLHLISSLLRFQGESCDYSTDVADQNLGGRSAYGESGRSAVCFPDEVVVLLHVPSARRVVPPASRASVGDSPRDTSCYFGWLGDFRVTANRGLDRVCDGAAPRWHGPVRARTPFQTRPLT